jgi:L-serine dehydratase
MNHPEIWVVKMHNTASKWIFSIFKHSSGVLVPSIKEIPMSDRSSIFDMIGPVMIGPSSSHTAGVVRIGKVAHLLLGGNPSSAEITFYNSFARTYEGHGSDRAVAAGLLGMETDDERIREALSVAAQTPLDIQFKAVNNASALHPNTVRIKAKRDTRELSMLGISRGGGLISILEIDGYRCNFTAQRHTLVISADDVKGSIAFIATVLSNDAANIATMTVDRKAKNLSARLVIEMDSELRPLTLSYIQSQSWIHDLIHLPLIGM